MSGEPLPTVDTWKNRRRMAYISLWAFILLIQEAVLIALFFPPTVLEGLMPVMSMSMFLLASVVGGYMGLSTISESKFWVGKPEKPHVAG